MIQFMVKLDVMAIAIVQIMHKLDFHYVKKANAKKVFLILMEFVLNAVLVLQVVPIVLM